MKYWKVVKKTFDGNVTKVLNEYFEFGTDDSPCKGDVLYFCYRRKWFFFWKLKYIKTQSEWDQTVSFMKYDGHRVNDLCNCINF